MALLEAKLGGQLPAEKPRLHVVGGTAAPPQPEQWMDEVERRSRIRWMRSLTRFYRHHGMDLILKQALVGKRELEDLSDDEILALHRDIDRARECIAEGITFDEAGLVRSHGEVA